MGPKSLKIFTGLALAAILVFILVSRSGDIRANLSKRDFVEYWASGQLLLHHHNPYDTDAFLELTSNRGLAVSKALVMRIPPWTLWIMLPLGLVDPYWGWLLWMALSAASLVIAMRLCWKMYGREAAAGSLIKLAGYVFAPVLGCLVVAQIGLLLLLGIVLFLLLESDRPFLAGAALILPFAKPHLLALFWLALLFWIVARKRWAVAAGFAAALFLATAVALLFDPSVFQHHRNLLSTAAIGREFIPALPGMLRLLFFRHAFWVQFVPLALGAIWCVWYYFGNRSNWDWHNHGSTVMVASVLTTPYGWFTDEVVLLPAMLQAAFWIACKGRTTLKTRLAVIMFACLNGLLVLMIAFRVPMASGMYFWSSLVWFLWFAYGRSRRRIRPSLTALDKF